MELTNLEKKYLRGLIINRNNKPKFIRLIKSFSLNWLALIVLISAASYCFEKLKLFEFCYIFYGLGLGAILRDLGWLNMGRRIWRIQQHTVNWQKVEELSSQL